jgi:hypothetical protein
MSAATLPTTIASEPTWQLLQGVILSNHCEPVLVAPRTPETVRSAPAR